VGIEGIRVCRKDAAEDAVEDSAGLAEELGLAGECVGHMGTEVLPRDIVDAVAGAVARVAEDAAASGGGCRVGSARQLPEPGPSGLGMLAASPVAAAAS